MIDFTLEGKVALLRMNDGKANAVGHGLIDAMNEALDRAEKEASAVVLIGRDGMFSAGFDLKELSKGADAALALVQKGFPLFLRLFSHPQATVAACNGHTVGAGVFLALACDTRFGALGPYKHQLPETAIGMNLTQILHELAAARISNRFLTKAVIQAHAFDPELAAQAGFIDEAVDADQLLERAMAEASALAELPNEVYARNKLDCRRPVIKRMQASVDKVLAGKM